MERIFIEEWNCVGRTEQVDHVGAWFTADAAGEPIVVTHAEDGQIRAMSSVCRHRYMAIASVRARAAGSSAHTTGGATLSTGP